MLHECASGTASCPFGRLAFAEPRNVRTSSRPSPRAFEHGRIDLDAHRRQRAAADEHLADAVDLRDLLLQDGRRDVVHLRAADGVRRQREDHDRRVGRVDLSIARVARQIRRQLASGRVDRRLHVARGAVDVAIEVELQRDLRRARAELVEVISVTPAMRPN